MKKLMYGTVSALALVLAVHGIAKADDYGPQTPALAGLAGSGTGNAVVGNGAFFTAVLGDNEIDANAFGQANGAFNVGQNSSINSSVQQSMAIGAVVNTPDASDTTGAGSNQLALAASVGLSFVGFNGAFIDAVAGTNDLQDNAFGQANGAFNVLQNRSINSGVSQSMAVGAVITNDGTTDAPDATPFGNQAALGVSALGSAVVGNIAGGVGVFNFGNTNEITANAFGQAHGAFNVLQNASVNSSVQQGMAVGAVLNVAH